MKKLFVVAVVFGSVAAMPSPAAAAPTVTYDCASTSVRDFLQTGFFRIGC
jgi:hypothetical protein